ncbi:unnamed protein product, partial [Staurois parvus]
MLKSTLRRSSQLSAESIAKHIQTSCGLQISTTTVHREHHGMGFHGQAAASKPYISKCNAKLRMQWGKTLLDSNSGVENSTCLTASCQVYG